MVEQKETVKLKYKGPDHQVLVLHKGGGSKLFKVYDGDIVEATPEEAKELIKGSDKERIFSKVSERKSSGKGD